MLAIGERLCIGTDQGRLAPLMPEKYRVSVVLNGRSVAARVTTVGLRSYIRIPVGHFAAILISYTAALESPVFLHNRVACLLET